jgi:hypothetical protein
MAIGLPRSPMEGYENLLYEPQSKNELTSDPHQVPIDLFFPFFILEAKGTTASLTVAGNQAAVGVAYALNILGQLDRLCAQFFPASPAAAPSFLFSMTTECSHYDLWIHYRQDNCYHMANVGAWRVSRRAHAAELVYALARIMAWPEIALDPKKIERDRGEGSRLKSAYIRCYRAVLVGGCRMRRFGFWYVNDVLFVVVMLIPNRQRRSLTRALN